MHVCCHVTCYGCRLAYWPMWTNLCDFRRNNPHAASTANVEMIIRILKHSMLESAHLRPLQQVLAKLAGNSTSQGGPADRLGVLAADALWSVALVPVILLLTVQ